MLSRGPTDMQDLLVNSQILLFCLWTESGPVNKLEGPYYSIKWNCLWKESKNGWLWTRAKAPTVIGHWTGKLPSLSRSNTHLPREHQGQGMFCNCYNGHESTTLIWFSKAAMLWSWCNLKTQRLIAHLLRLCIQKSSNHYRWRKKRPEETRAEMVQHQSFEVPFAFSSFPGNMYKQTKMEPFIYNPYKILQQS